MHSILRFWKSHFFPKNFSSEKDVIHEDSVFFLNYVLLLADCVVDRNSLLRVDHYLFVVRFSPQEVTFSSIYDRFYW